jgi:hypothetical protein
VAVIVRDLGFNALLARLRMMGVSALTVGIHDDAGEAGDGLTVAQVAAFHEFGTVRVPERSFIRSTLDNQRTSIEARVRDITRSVISNRRRLTPKAALGILGLDLQRRIQETIRRGIPPSLVSREGTPLIDTGQLIQSITFKVT